MAMSNVMFSPGCVLTELGKLVIDKGSSTTKAVERVAHMYVNAMAIGPNTDTASSRSNIMEIW
jgi:hypothetical protein